SGERHPMNDNPRALRLADRIKVIVATMLDTRVKDPRLGFVTITDVRVTGDLQHATVFYTVFGTDEEREGTAAALESATGMLRREVGRQTGVRLTPTLEFIADAVPENARVIEDLLSEARGRDAELEKAKAGATYAGEADPDRKPREEELEGEDSTGATEPGDDTSGEDETGREQPCPPPRTARRPPHPAPPRTGCCWSTRPRDAPAMTWSPGSDGCWAPRRWVTRAPSTRWRPDCWCSASARAPACSPTWWDWTRPTRRRSDWGAPPPPTTGRANRSARSWMRAVSPRRRSPRTSPRSAGTSPRCPPPSAPSRSTGSAPTPGPARGRTCSSPPGP